MTGPMTETAKLEALKPCPFCGGALWIGEVKKPAGDEGWAVCGYRAWCTTCKMSLEEKPTEAEAITAWNTRALSVSRPAVKGLEWSQFTDRPGDETASSVVGEYVIRPGNKGGAHFRLWVPGIAYNDAQRFDILEAAKAAAQSDFEQRILSSLSPPTGGWKDIATYSGHGGALVSRPSDRFFYEPLSAFKDATGVWRVLGSKGGMTKVKFDPTHWQPLPSPPEAE